MEENGEKVHLKGFRLKILKGKETLIRNLETNRKLSVPLTINNIDETNFFRSNLNQLLSPKILFKNRKKQKKLLKIVGYFLRK